MCDVACQVFLEDLLTADGLDHFAELIGVGDCASKEAHLVAQSGVVDTHARAAVQPLFGSDAFKLKTCICDTVPGSEWGDPECYREAHDDCKTEQKLAHQLFYRDMFVELQTRAAAVNITLPASLQEVS